MMWIVYLFALVDVCIPVEADCELSAILAQEEEDCYGVLSQQNLSEIGYTTEAICEGMWDQLICWPSSIIGKTVAVPCPNFLIALTGTEGFVYRNCTSHGWSDSFPRHDVACGLNHNSTVEEVSNSYFMNLKTVYTVGYSTSMVSLIIAIAILCFFKKLHCSRNFIHMQLFVSFVLRALSVLIKDRILFSSEDIYHCNVEWEGCKFALFFFHYCIMANYSWLLIEGLYLHTLLVVSFFTAKKYFWWYISFGWGSPMIFVIAWSIARKLHDDVGCWENENLKIKWIIKGPIIITIFINFIFFVNIIKILIGKLKTMDTSQRKDFSQYKRLAKSTLLLIPLFGMHYTVLAFIPGNVSSQVFYARLFFELGIGSFQGFVVAVLYCFLNGEVQSEIRRKWGRWRLKKHFYSDSRNNRSSISNGGSGVTQVSLSTRVRRKSSLESSSLV
ncbi:secretin receptor-like isoform X1 [Erpetoichthys calabaricus]|uniref:secretin receptor-like isoform X1 n=1 Tax=Erpetoichthys calabaricus TaxID=27687 RepID=UPI00109F9B10|nr:secretin receptor-like isoform X1 [Erpetoichthys calabaricus]